MAHFVYMMILGLIAGAVVRLLRSWSDAGDWLMSLILGMAGAFLGGIMANFMGLSLGGLSISTGIVILLSLLGASVLLIGYEVFAEYYGEYDDDYDDDDYYDDDDDYDEDDDEKWHR